MKKLAVLILCLLSLSATAQVMHLPSIQFFTAYSSEKLVVHANKTNQLDEDLNFFLYNPDQPIGQKAALINALGWKTNGSRANVFCKLNFQKPAKLLNQNSLSADQLFVIGYLMAMDSEALYLSKNPTAILDNALTFLESAVQKNPKSLTIQLVTTLVKSQANKVDDRCEPLQSVEKLLTNKDLTNDLSDAAVKQILQTLQLHAKGCK